MPTFDPALVPTTDPVFAGDSVPLAVSVLNSGALMLGQPNFCFGPESDDVLLDTPALTAGSSAWVNTTITAPSSGLHTVQ